MSNAPPAAAPVTDATVETDATAESDQSASASASASALLAPAPDAVLAASAEYRAAVASHRLSLAAAGLSHATALLQQISDVIDAAPATGYPAAEQGRLLELFESVKVARERATAELEAAKSETSASAAAISDGACAF
jgi:hypothetical protein